MNRVARSASNTQMSSLRRRLHASPRYAGRVPQGEVGTLRYPLTALSTDCMVLEVHVCMCSAHGAIANNN